MSRLYALSHIRAFTRTSEYKPGIPPVAGHLPSEKVKERLTGPFIVMVVWFFLALVPDMNGFEAKNILLQLFMLVLILLLFSLPLLF